ncbi:MAG: phage protein NinX family protein [Shewanella sp.]
MNYEEMSDFEINGCVSMHMHGFSWIEFVDGHASNVKCGNEGSPGFARIEVCNYCNNPSDAWPIIDKHKICIHNDEMEGRSYACSFDKFGYVSKESYCDKTLRAAMIVFLMMQEQVK